VATTLVGALTDYAIKGLEAMMSERVKLMS